MNYKLKDIPLYTHSFLQEGFAVAFGGRGGKDAEVILNLGRFISESNFLNYNELLNQDSFRKTDASMSYPMSGLYNKFLIKLFGIDDYLELYLKYSANDLNNSTISQNDLPPESEWQHFVGESTNFEQIKVDFNEKDFKTIVDNSTYTLKEDKDAYLIKTSGNILISTPKKNDNYTSTIFRKFYPEIRYDGEKYLIRINDNEISVYNLLTNNLIASYVRVLTLDMKPVPKGNSLYTFCIDKSVFDESLNEWSIKNIEK